jgi:hypothetical protein
MGQLYSKRIEEVLRIEIAGEIALVWSIGAAWYG